MGQIRAKHHERHVDVVVRQFPQLADRLGGQVDISQTGMNYSRRQLQPRFFRLWVFTAGILAEGGYHQLARLGEAQGKIMNKTAMLSDELRVQQR
jgi:hypothetical protein